MALSAIVLISASTATGYAIDAGAPDQPYNQAISDDEIFYFNINIYDNNSTITVTNDTIFFIGLKENSYIPGRWYLNHTDGLSIVDESYYSIFDPISDPIWYYYPIDSDYYKPITHIWTIRAVGQGTQSISANFTYSSGNVSTDGGHFGMTVIIQN